MVRKMKPSAKTTARRPKFDLTPISVDEALSNPALASIESTLRQLAGLDDKPTSVVDASDSDGFSSRTGNLGPDQRGSNIGDTPIAVSHTGDSPIGEINSCEPVQPHKMHVDMLEVGSGSSSSEVQQAHVDDDSTTGLSADKAPIRHTPIGTLPIGISQIDLSQAQDHLSSPEFTPTGDTPIGASHSHRLESDEYTSFKQSLPIGNTPIGTTNIDHTESNDYASAEEPTPTGDTHIGVKNRDSTITVPASSPLESMHIGDTPIGRSRLDVTNIADRVSSVDFIPIGIHPTDESHGNAEVSDNREPVELDLSGGFDLQALPLPGVAAESPRYRQKVRPASDVQDGHSNGEQLLYQALWRVGKVETPDTKLVTIGYGGMHDIAKLDRSNCKKNILSLIQKLAIETVGQHSVQRNVGKTYRVYSYSAILRRRRQAGMLYIVRANGVRFVRPDGNLLTGHQVSLAQIQQSQNQSPIGYPPTGGSTMPQRESPIGITENPPTAPLGKTRIGPIGEAPRVYKKLKEETNNFTQQTASTSVGEPAPEQLSQSLNELLPFIDDQAVRFLWTECRNRVADCSVTEVIYFTKAKAAVLASGKIQNPIGFLLTAVPKCFEGQSFLAFRRALREQTDAEAKLRRQREQAQRQAEEDTQREIEAYTRAEETLNSMSQNDRDLLRQNVTREYLKRYPSARHMLDFESWIRRMMIREIVKKPGGFSK